MKKLLITTIVCLLVLSSLSANALTVQEADGNISDASQIYRVTALANGTITVVTKNEPTLWEQPTLKAGDYMVRSSSLILHNTTGKTQNIELETVELPYENEAALRYLDHLTITVSNGNTVLYKGPYSRINEDESFVMKAELPTDNQIVFNISLSCDYQYTGAGFGANDLIQWKFRAEVPDNGEGNASTDNTESFANPTLLQVALAAGLSILLLASITLYRRFIVNR